MEIKIIGGAFSVCRLKDLGQARIEDDLYFLGRADEEISLVCGTESVPEGTASGEGGWKALRIQGELDFPLIGILAGISAILAGRKIGIFVVSTYNADYILTGAVDFKRAVTLLEGHGYGIAGQGPEGKRTGPAGRQKEHVRMIEVRSEGGSDYRMTEDIARKASYSLHVPGYGEHYLIHIICEYEGFIPELGFVPEPDGRVVRNIMYTKARLADKPGAEKEILTLDPVSVAPEHQRRSCGRTLTEHSFERAVPFRYDVIIVFGGPTNCVSSDFKGCKKFSICPEDGSFPAAMTARELVPGMLDGRRWIHRDSPVMVTSEKEAHLYDDSLERVEKKRLPSQEEFYITSHSFIR